MSYENIRVNSSSDIKHTHNYDGGVFFDERKKRFVNMNNMDPISMESYSSVRLTVNIFYNFQYRPDLYDSSAKKFDNFDFKLGVYLLKYMYLLRISEYSRTLFMFQNQGCAEQYAFPVKEHHLKLGNVDHGGNRLKFYVWDDAVKIANYFEWVMRRITKYQLHWGINHKYKFDNYKNEIKKSEDELVDYFLYEMRKPPTDKPVEYHKFTI